VEAEVKLAPAPDEWDAWIEHLRVPHRAKRAYWHLVLSPAALPAVERALEHDDAVVRRACCRILDHLADPSTFPLLVPRLDDDDAETRANALHALTCDRCKDDACATPSFADTLPRAIAMMRDDPSGRVRAHALGFVGKHAIDDERALAAVLDTQANDPDPSLRKMAGWYAPGGTRHRKLLAERRARRAR
jgi:hypothetical protein